ncbi:MAG: transcription elongation factor GreA [Parcubacteria group bacterium LiPW_15]|nr:MAG: transcription elongation factor GreA [Parcubacteria group bacterium LiPW_15]
MTYYLTPERLEELKKELEILKGQKRNEVSERLLRAKEFGDLSENSEYVEAREEQSRVETRIYELEDMMKHVSIIKKGDGGVEARIGSTLTVEKDGVTKTFTIVGSEESKPEENKISNESPLGAAFLGKKAGDSAQVSTPNGQATYKITRVE